MKYLIAIAIGYFIGCIQTSFILVKLVSKQDIRSIGYGNAGASNVFDRVSKRMGIFVAITDILKAVVSMIIIRLIFKQDIQAGNMLLLYLNGAAVVAGHNYPFFMGFKGGKGTASTVGMCFGIDYRLGILSILVVLIVTLATDYISLGAISLIVFLLIATIYLQFSIGCLVVAFLMLLVSLFNHRKNIKRIINKEENGLRGAFNKKA